MIIDLATPLWGGIAAGIILAVIFSLVRFAIVIVEKNAIEKKFMHLISEMELLQKSHKNEIAGIKEANLKVMKNIFTEHHKSVKEILDKYHRLVPPARLAFLEHLEKTKDENVS